jgi:hypothetical protein
MANDAEDVEGVACDHAVDAAKSGDVSFFRALDESEWEDLVLHSANYLLLSLVTASVSVPTNYVEEEETDTPEHVRECVEMLLKRGASPDAELVGTNSGIDGATALYWAVATRQPVLVELLLEWGADKHRVDVSDSDGETPLSISMPHSRVRELLEQSESLRARFLRRRALRRWRVCRWVLRLSTYQAYLQRRFAPKTLKTDESGRSYMTCDAIDEMVEDCGSSGL